MATFPPVYGFGGTGTGGLFQFYPNPPVEGRNLFIHDSSVDGALALANAYFATDVGLKDYDLYKNNPNLMIILKWGTGSDTHISYRSLVQDATPVGTYIWVDPFDRVFAEIDLSTHSFTELRGGAALDTTVRGNARGIANNAADIQQTLIELNDVRIALNKLDSETVKGVVCEGSDGSVDLCEDLVKDNKIYFRRVKPIKGLRINPNVHTKDIEFEVYGSFLGYFESVAQLEAAASTITTHETLTGIVKIAGKGVNKWNNIVYVKEVGDSKFTPRAVSGYLTLYDGISAPLPFTSIKPDSSLDTSIELVNVPGSTNTVKTLKISAKYPTFTQGSDTSLIKKIEAGTNITTSMVDGVLTIGSAGGGGGTGGGIEVKTPSAQGYKPISRIEIVGDGPYSFIEHDQLTIRLQAPIEVVANKAALDALKPVLYNQHMGLTLDTENFYWCNGVGWQPFAYVGMGDQVKSLNQRLPETIPYGVQYNPDINKSLSYVHVTEADAKNKLNLPIAEEGFIQNIYSEDTGGIEKWVQNFYGIDSGTVWVRTKSTGNDFKGWVAINALDESYHSVLTLPEDLLFNEYLNGTKELPFIPLQDPRGNIFFANDTKIPKVIRSGRYDITLCLHITGQNDWPCESANFKFSLYGEAGNLLATSIAGNVSTGLTSDSFGKYPSIYATFKDVFLNSEDSLHVKVKMTGQTSDMNGSFLDPYKNFLVVEPANSRSKTGLNVAKTYRATLGGMSFKEGYEVRVEASSESASNPRVYGARYNKELHLLA
ncbi:MAG: hypothetical protein ACRCR2_02420 [Fusobacteriaceae bacterium]